MVLLKFSEPTKFSELVFRKKKKKKHYFTMYCKFPLVDYILICILSNFIPVVASKYIGYIKRLKYGMGF